MEGSPSLAYGAVLERRLGITSLASSNLAPSAQDLEDSPSLAYGAGLEIRLGMVPREFKSHILRSQYPGDCPSGQREPS